jgi:hypothetical protein
MTVTKAADLALAIVGVVLAAKVIVERRRGQASPAVGESRSG